MKKKRKTIEQIVNEMPFRVEDCDWCDGMPYNGSGEVCQACDGKGVRFFDKPEVLKGKR